MQPIANAHPVFPWALSSPVNRDIDALGYHLCERSGIQLQAGCFTTVLEFGVNKPSVRKVLVEVEGGRWWGSSTHTSASLADFQVTSPNIWVFIARRFEENYGVIRIWGILSDMVKVRLFFFCSDRKGLNIEDIMKEKCRKNIPWNMSGFNHKSWLNFKWLWRSWILVVI